MQHGIRDSHEGFGGLIEKQTIGGGAGGCIEGTGRETFDHV